MNYRSTLLVVNITKLKQNLYEGLTHDRLKIYYHTTDAAEL